MHLLPVGRNAVLVEVASPAEAVSLATWARDRSLAVDVVPGARTVLLDGVVTPTVSRGCSRPGARLRSSPARWWRSR